MLKTINIWRWDGSLPIDHEGPDAFVVHLTQDHAPHADYLGGWCAGAPAQVYTTRAAAWDAAAKYVASIIGDGGPITIEVED